ncbi:MAG: hypothetical protein PHX43_08560 [Alphaproteobacteria bacterium]|nr:hypothetical protein [Alphaproteobacteria bacterium]
MIGRHEEGFENGLASEAGIAIGPILFVIAVLGILASAIAAGSGSFTAGSAAENNRTKASAMIEIGQNLKIGWERITGSAGIDFDSVVIDPNMTANANDLFSPLGGGISVPSVTMAEDPINDKWYYVKGNMPGLGSRTAPNMIAVLKVASGVCSEINNKANGFLATAVPPSADVGDFHATTDIPDSNILNNWPTALASKPTGCINNTNGTPGGYYFYQVIGLR